MKNRLVVICLLIGISFTINAQNKKEVTYKSADDVQITSDLYLTDDLNSPFILLFHQAMFSRGEYIEIAPKLNKLGFNCIAVDQRSGQSVNDMSNKTHKFAKDLGKKTKYKDAFPDLQACLDYIKNSYKTEKIIVWGSSYSASLVLVLAAKNKEIEAVLSFSPGEYFEYENKMMKDWIKEVECPVFVTSSQKEGPECKIIFENASNSESVQYIPDQKGFHGSKALWESKKGNELYWNEVKEFLSIYSE